MRAIDINRHFLERAPWVDPEKTVDKIIVGNPEKEIRTVLVTWISSLAAVRTAIDRGFNMLMTHEPTFYDHLDINRERTETGKEKLRLIEESGLVIVRNHDVWDRFPEVGIPWAWAQFLGFDGKPVAKGLADYMHRYDIEPIALGDLARKIAARTASLGEPFVQVVGDPGRKFSRISVGTGCACNSEAARSIGCDASIVCDDGSIYWANLQWAADTGHGVIRVNHGTSEEPGMVTLTQYINDSLPGVRAEHLPHGSCFRLAGAAA